MSTWTTADIPDQSGRTAVITGANTGLGFETAKALADKGARVVLAVRDTDKGRQAAARIGGDVTVQELDLTSLASIRAASEELHTKFESLDLLINNAGVMTTPKATTKDGFELQFGTNHLGHFALTGHLLPLLENTESSRVVTVSSIVHNSGRIDFDDLNGDRKRYSKWGFYAQSKIANLLFSLELARRLETNGSGVRSLASHPGYTATDLQRHSLLWRFLNLIVAMPARRGAESTLYAATEDDALDYPYWGPTGIIEMMGWTGRARINSRARDETVASRLWEVSESMTGVSYLTPPS